MKTKQACLSTLLVGLGLCVGASVNAALIPGLFNTGVDNANTPLPNTSLDPHYSLATGSPVVGSPIAVTSAIGFPIPPWLADNLSSTWIAPTSNTVGPGATDGSAVYRYQIQFDLTGLDPATAVITGQWSTDNYGSDILINGAATGQTNNSQFGAWTPFGITHGFISGVNTLTFMVNNGTGETATSGPSGLRVEMRGTALMSCLDFQALLPMNVPNPWIHQGIRFFARDPAGAPLVSSAIRSDGGFNGLSCGWQLEMDLPSPCNSVDVTLVDFAAPPFAIAYDSSFATVATAAMSGPQKVPETLTLKGTGITRVVVICPSDETLLLEVCCRPGTEGRLLIETITEEDGAVTLSWTGQPGKTYRVQFKAKLNEGSWKDLAGDVVARGNSASKVDKTLRKTARRFYRVIEVPSAAAPGSPTVSGSPANATVSWSLAAGASGYSVERWSLANPDCCRTSSPLLPAAATSWADSNYPLEGIYIFRITAHFPNGTSGVAEVSWVRPTPQDPVGFAAVPIDGTTVQLSWQPVPGVTHYLVGGPGADSGVPVSGTTLSLAEVPAGLQTWTIFSLYEPGGVFTHGVSTSVVVPVVLSGWADLHTHPMINLAFGGKLVHGGVDVGSLLPQDTSCNGQTRATSMAHALGDDRPSHGGHNFFTFPCGDELRKLLIGTFQTGNHAFVTGPQALGFPSFDQWPRWNEITHQKMWFEWIKRARDGGLRVMVALATNNKTLADGVKGPGDDLPTDDKASADLQITEIKAFVARHNDFMEVALSAADIKRIVQANKIAVVVGVEIDNIGNFNAFPITNLPVAAAEILISNEIQRLYDSGVRYIFPVHVLDNAFGGTAIYKNDFNTSNLREAGHYWILECAPMADSITHTYEEGFDPLRDAGAFIKLGLDPFRHAGPGPVCVSGQGHRNALGLTPLGVIALKEMMKRGMMIDIDHMSQRSADATLDLAETFGYPVVSGHTGIRGLAGADAENSRTRLQLQRLSKLHGMFGLGSDGALAMQWSQLYQQAMFEMGYLDPDPAKANYRNGAISFGTDLNGLVKGPMPGGGGRVNYDATFPMSSSGTKSWDYNTEGVAHYGMLPDFIRDVRTTASIGYIEPGWVPRGVTGPELVDKHLFRSADYFWHMWERIEAQKANVP